MDGDRPVPEQRRQSPGIGTSDSRQVHESRKAAVTPIGDCLVDEVGDEDDLCAPEVVTGPEENPGQEEKVVQDKVGGNIGSGRDKDRVLGEEVPDIAELGKKQEDPGWQLAYGSSGDIFMDT
jgi:hypothetical protein